MMAGFLWSTVRNVPALNAQKVIVLTHGGSKPRRVTVPDSQVPFDIAERLVGIPKVDRFKDRGLWIVITSPRPPSERATGEFSAKVPKDKELRHYLGEAWKQLNHKATEGGLTENGSAARDQIGKAIRTRQVSGNRWSPETLAHIEAAVEHLHQAVDDPLAPYQTTAPANFQKALGLIEFDSDLPRALDAGPDLPSPRPSPQRE